MKFKKIITSLCLSGILFSAQISAQVHYFEDPVDITGQDIICRFPLGASSLNNKGSSSAYFWQETKNSSKAETTCDIYISESFSKNGISWTNKEKIIGPFNTAINGKPSETMPLIYSVAQNGNGIIAIAVLSSPTEITVFSSKNNFDSYESYVIKNNENQFVAPRIYVNSKDEFVLFLTKNSTSEGSLITAYSLCYTKSKNGKSWSEFKDFNAAVTSANIMNPIVPYLASDGTNDYVVYQAQYRDSSQSTNRNAILTQQLFLSTSSDACDTWSEGILISGAESLHPVSDKGKVFYNFNNQGACLLCNSNSIYVAWERSPSVSSNADIYFAELNSDGSIKGSAEKISNGGFSSRPLLFESENAINLLWFRNIESNQAVFLAQKSGVWWNETSEIASGKTTYPCYILTNSNLSLAWERKNSSTTKISFMNSDHSTQAPKLTGVNFKDGEHSKDSKIQAKITPSYDHSGVKGFSWIWTQNKKDTVPESDSPMNITEDNILNLATKENSSGYWFLKVKQQDYAGNWSKESTISYYFDDVPPAKVKIGDLSLDEYNLLSSSNFNFTWEADSKDDDIAGYTYSLIYLDSIPAKLASNSRHPTKMTPEEIKDAIDGLYEKNLDLLDFETTDASIISRQKNKFKLPKSVMTKKNTISYRNRHNGLYVFAVAAIDKVGNIGEASYIEIFNNKFIPYTYISNVNQQVDKFGDIQLDITGGGFKYDGKITSVYLDKDGREPYDYTLNLSSSDYKLISDNTINGIRIQRMEPGTYKIGLYHSDRGLYFSKDATIDVVQTGNVKKKIDYVYQPVWKIIDDIQHKNLNITTLVVLIVCILAIIGIIISSVGLFISAKETKQVKKEVMALIEGDIMPQEKKRKAIGYKQKGVSLRTKLILYTTTLITLMDVLIFIIFGFYMIRTQRTTLTQSLEQRVNVILESISGTAKLSLTSDPDLVTLNDAAAQSEALRESNWATILGYSSSIENTKLDTIWATTDAAVSEKTDNDVYRQGVSRLVITELKEILEEAENLNLVATQKVSEISDNLAILEQEARSLSGKRDEVSIARQNEIQNIYNQLTEKITKELNNLSDEAAGSYPQFTADSLNSENENYIFYKPVISRRNNDSTYVHGLILVQISTETLLDQINREKNIIIITALVILFIAVILSFISTSVLAGVFVRPINRLVSHVEMIRDTEDKSNLFGKKIEIKTRDELGILGDTVNEMTRGLVEAAEASKTMNLGKDVQTKFIPLQTDSNGFTLTTGTLSAKGADFFSYYAGADDLSGDYFDYKQLDEYHYAIIKADVSGHGVPAALIMVEVATLFLSYFKNWDMKNPKQGYNLAPVVGQINDLLESRGFKGRFAAFTLCILNTKTGECHFCNAGDNLVQIYDSTMHKKKTLTLQETPAAGMFSTDLIDMKGGYLVSKVLLKKDDVLFLYTDGIEEAKRNFRDENYNLITCQEEGIADGEAHGNHSKGEGDEEMTAERVTSIIEAVYAKSKYVLEKYHCPQRDRIADFDFTNCSGSAEDAIMALVSVEKIFRMYKPLDVKANDRVKVDKKIDAFLRQHFVQYSNYCNDKHEIENDPTHIYYYGVLEDPQYDDLTLVAIKKN